MIHGGTVGASGVVGGGGGGGNQPTISQSPASYNGANQTITVTITTTFCAKYRWKFNTGAWTTVNATSGTVSVQCNNNLKTLFSDGLDSNNVVLASTQGDYQGTN